MQLLNTLKETEGKQRRFDNSGIRYVLSCRMMEGLWVRIHFAAVSKLVHLVLSTMPQFSQLDKRVPGYRHWSTASE